MTYEDKPVTWPMKCRVQIDIQENGKALIGGASWDEVRTAKAWIDAQAVNAANEAWEGAAKAVDQMAADAEKITKNWDVPAAIREVAMALRAKNGALP